jgi:hypothetical protein
MAAINESAIINPAGLVPCYNVLLFDPNTGMFISEVRLFQVVSLEQPALLEQVTGSGVLFEFPYAQITSSPDESSVLGKRSTRLVRRQTPQGQVNLVQTFYMNGTAEVDNKYYP